MNFSNHFVSHKATYFLLLIVVSACFVFGFQFGANYRAIHYNALLVDTHNDVVQRVLGGEDISFRTLHGHSDLPRFIEGGVDVQMFSIWVPPEKKKQSYYAQANEQIDSIMSFVKRNPEQTGFARTANEAVSIALKEKLAAMLGMEGGHPIGNDLKKLEHFYKRGVRYMTLTWNNSTDWATSAKDETDTTLHLKHKGLTEFGKKVVQKMNELGMMVDVSHVGEQTFWDVMSVTKKPVIASHSDVWALRQHRRNLKDDQIKAIAKSGGVVFINFAPWFIDSTFSAKEDVLHEEYKHQIDSLKKAHKGPEWLEDFLVWEMLFKEYLKIRPPLSMLIDHFDYVVKLVGVDHVGVGSDFDGITAVPGEMDDVSCFPNITRELLNRGYKESDVKKILGENFLRVMREVEKK
ncbi:MAG: membrane dipeptidase [Ignavibacteriae bacterium]|nr:membrane dipeptidase [Ignavibacteriota bacterium]